MRNALKQWLPDYMVPSKFIISESLPLNSNGKVNRQELPTPELGKSKIGTQFNAPSTPVELMFAKIWREALSIETVGRIFPWNLTLAEFYDAFTIAQGTQLLVHKAPDVEQAERLATLYLKIHDSSSAEVEAMLAGERNKRGSKEKVSTSRND